MALRRLKKDLQGLRKTPLIGASAEPSEEDFTLWNAVVMVELTEANSGHKKWLPMHFLIDFPDTYPNYAPNIGFSVKFPYKGGASYVIKESGSKLVNKMVLCLDLLGNFADVHTEWKKSVGSGWTSAYDVQTLLVNLQSVLADLDENLRPEERSELIRHLEKFARDHEDDIPECLTREEVELQNLTKSLDDETRELAKNLGIEKDFKKMSFLREYCEKRSAPCDKNQEKEETSGTEPKLQKEDEEQPKTPEKPKIDENIVCYNTGLNYTEAVLGYGVTFVNKNTKTGRVDLSTPAELLSLTAFKEGCRTSTTKIEFQYFIPAFINRVDHQAKKEWQDCLKNELTKIGNAVYQKSNLMHIANEVFPTLINTLCVEMMKTLTSDEVPYPQYGGESWSEYEAKLAKFEAEKGRYNKSPSLAYFEAICSLWRTYYWLATGPLSATLMKANVEKAANFMSKEQCQLKEAVPDLGRFLVQYSICKEKCLFTTDKFLETFLRENFIRQVRFYQDELIYSGRRPDFARFGRTLPNTPSLAAVYEKTQISRDIILFQVFFLRYIVGTNPQETCRLMDHTNGKAPQRISKLQETWKKYKDEKGVDPGQQQYFRFLSFMGMSRLFDDFGIAETAKNDRDSMFVVKVVNWAHDRGFPYGGPANKILDGRCDRNNNWRNGRGRGHRK